MSDETIYALNAECDAMQDEIERLTDENAKLRELSQRMRRYMADAVEHCGYDAQTTGYTMLGSRLEECEDAMRKLGVEVGDVLLRTE